MTTAAWLFHTRGRARARAGCESPRRLRWWLSRVALVSLLALSGCGGGSPHTASTPTIAASTPEETITASNPVGPALSRSQLIARADAICERRNSAIDAVKLHGTSPEAITRFASQSAALEQSALLDLSRLYPPASMSAQWQQTLAYSRTLLQGVLTLGHYAQHHDTRVIPALSRSVQSVKRQLLAAATRDGFRYCSRVR
jgi:hypothetical protein